MSLLLVEDAGPLTTVQDLGRPGYLRVGIPASGPMDREAFLLANRLIGNPDTAAGLECTLIGPRLAFTDERLVAITGADMAPTVNGAPVPAWQGLRVRAGDVLRLGPARSGVRAYLAIAGGVDTPPVLGSRATYVRGRLGGLDGRALRKGDRLPLGRVGAARPRRVQPERVPTYGGEPELAVVLGPQDERFTGAGIAALFEGPYQMLPQNDRMGARLQGPFIEHTRGHDIISDGVALGGIQVIGEGQPIVLLADRQSTGGYTKIGTVCSFDIGRIAQVKPGGRLHFRRVTVAEAHAMLRQSLRALDAAIE
ncbi:MAG TPA: biotin-dependent carboxyltransferase family protein [Candidatus Deferrimicrobiaceae bacterium]|nr:biotin-dependent carboxyltransferase family protein [Candidatus Deferrimicrobiaceae bacterium]